MGNEKIELNEDEISGTEIAMTSEGAATSDAITPNQVLRPFPAFQPVKLPLNTYQQEFLNLQNELMNDETEKLQRDNEDRKRMFDEVNDSWNDNFLDRNF